MWGLCKVCDGKGVWIPREWFLLCRIRCINLTRSNLNIHGLGNYILRGVHNVKGRQALI